MSPLTLLSIGEHHGFSLTLSMRDVLSLKGEADNGGCTQTLIAITRREGTECAASNERDVSGPVPDRDASGERFC